MFYVEFFSRQVATKLCLHLFTSDGKVTEKDNIACWMSVKLRPRVTLPVNSMLLMSNCFIRKSDDLI